MKRARELAWIAADVRRTSELGGKCVDERIGSSRNITNGHR
jgi:hypothetical protein